MRFKKIYWIVDPNGKIITEPYWEKSMSIIHVEETEFPLSWKQLYRAGYRVKSADIVKNGKNKNP